MSSFEICESRSSESIEKNIIKQSDGPLTYRVATLADCEQLSVLINSAYRGEISCQGWTTEHLLLGGQRIDPEMLADLINDKMNIILLFFDPTGNILIGSVYLQHKPITKNAYLGMFTVRPDLQAQGYGKLIMSIAEDYVINNWNVEYIEMTVIIHRKELIEYYKRRGYFVTGRREPFPMHDRKCGIPKRTDLEFIVMKKHLKKT